MLQSPTNQWLIRLESESHVCRRQITSYKNSPRAQTHNIGIHIEAERAN